ncbi:MAG: tetratricopeptide repeat protein [Chloroflexota bacterium]
MFRVTSLTEMPEKQLNRLIRRIALLFVIVLIAFVAFYVIDRWRAPVAPMVDREIATLEDAVRASPADFASRGKLADAYFAKGRFDDAVTQYTALIDSKQNVELASLRRGDAYRELKKWPEATTDYNRVIEIGLTGEMANVDPSLEAAYYGLGMIALTQQKPADAIEPLVKATAINHTDADALSALGLAYVLSGKAQDALTPLRSAIALVPIGWADPYTNLAAAYTSLGQKDMAAWATAMAQLASGDAAGAETALKTLLAGDARMEATVGLGLASELKGDTVAAADWYKQALAIDPTNTPAQLGLQRVNGPGSAAPSPAASTGSN